MPLLQNKERYHITFFCLSEPEFHHSVVRHYFLVSYVLLKLKQYLHFIGAYKSDCRAEYSFYRIKNHTLSQPEMRNINYYKDRLIRHFIYLLVSWRGERTTKFQSGLCINSFYQHSTNLTNDEKKKAFSLHFFILCGILQFSNS